MRYYIGVDSEGVPKAEETTQTFFIFSHYKVAVRASVPLSYISADARQSAGVLARTRS